MGKIVCPKCEKDDQIQKVTSIRTGGVSTTNYGNIYGGRETAVSVTDLASRLHPPKNSKKKPNPFFWAWVFTWFVFLCPTLLWGGSLLIEQAAGGGNNTFFLIVIAEFVVAGIYTWMTNGKMFEEFRTGEYEAQKKMEKYLELYYCYRDDCVFDPKTGKYTTPEGMDRLLQ